MRFGFVTCVRLGLACMEEIEAVGGHLDIVLTLRDDLAVKKSGRAYFDDFCRAHGAELVKIANINDDDSIDTLRAADLDWLFIIGWSQIASPEVLKIPRYGALGIHPTLLPVGRGRAPIPWAIINGLDETGVTLFQLDDGLDTGPIISQHRLPLSPHETATTLYERVAEAHRILIRESWARLAEGTADPTPQDESRATIWPGRKPEDGRITTEMTVDEVDRLVRGTTHPYPGAFFDSEDGRLRVWAGSKVDADGIGIPLSDGTYWATQVDRELTS